ncbi:MAG: hypothetical protein GX666_02320 [Tissierellia bacterium]|nr:hypothetical protein [Tissierellia bacterium]
MTRKNITLMLVLVLLISILPANVMANSDYYSHMRRDVSFTAKDSTDGKNLMEVTYHIFKGESNYRADMGTTLNDTRLEPGIYTITATKDGYKVGTRVIDVRGTSTLRQYFNFDLDRDIGYRPPSADQSNYLYLNARDATTGYNISDIRYYIENLNNSSKNQTIYSSSVYLPVGNYRVNAIRDGYISQSQNVYMTGSRQDVSFTLSRSAIYPPTRTELTIKNVSVYTNRVTGETDSYSKVSLYKNGVFLNSTTANYSGYFEVPNAFQNYADYYGANRVYPSTNSSNRVAGYTTPYTRVLIYDANYVYLGSATSDSKGYYETAHTSVRNPNGKILLKDKGEGYYKFADDLSNYYLIAEKDGYTSSGRFYLTNLAYKDWDDVYSPPASETAIAPTIIEALPGEYYVRGKDSSTFSKVTVKERSGIEIGSVELGHDTRFAIKTSRPLVSGETLTIVTSKSGLRDNITTVIVGSTSGEDKPTYYFNYRNQFTIGQKSYIQTVDDVVSTKHMDVAPYITNGRTMLPIRYVAESLGYDVSFDNNTKNAIFLKGDSSIIMNLNSRDFFVKGQKHTFSVDPITVDGRIMLPFSELGKALGLTHGNVGEGKNIEWNEALRAVTIQINR